jgi:predicted ATP-grasp superfamily ATP-dependent carboligase
MKKNVLVFPCGSEIGLEVYKSLNASTHFNLIGGSSVDDHGKYVYANYFGDLPMVGEPDFVPKLNAIIDELQVKFIIPAHDSVVLALAQAKSRGELHCDVITSPADTCDIARSKKKTYEVLTGVIETPRIYESADTLSPQDYPVFLKPEVGQGSKGTHKATVSEQVAFYLSEDPTLMILEYLPGKEYTVDCFTDRHGELRFAEGRERIRISNGISVSSASVADDRFQELAEKINSKIVFRGVWFFQVKERLDGELVLMEIAPRIAGTMGLVRAKGINMALLSLFDAMDYDVDIFENKYAMTIDRALQNSYKHNIDYRHVYLDFDDLVIYEGKVNPVVMAFVFQCLNNQIEVHLLTRHKQDLDATLRQYRLTGIFDDVIWIQNEGDKHSYIKEKDAIFIDDSFAERKAVYDELGTPVFDAHMIEALLEKF